MKKKQVKPNVEKKKVSKRTAQKVYEVPSAYTTAEQHPNISDDIDKYVGVPVSELKNGSVIVQLLRNPQDGPSTVSAEIRVSSTEQSSKLTEVVHSLDAARIALSNTDDMSTFTLHIEFSKEPIPSIYERTGQNNPFNT